jgi:hypothetical protein
MGIKTIGWARLALKQQVEFFGGDQISLDSLWRAADCPDGRDPRTWSELASPLLSGFAAYLGKLDGGPRRLADPSRLIWTWEDDSKDPWRTGDLMADEFIAWAYATYLDNYAAHKNRPAASSLICS